MKWFSLSKEIAMDLGTANTIIISDGKIVVDEPSVVALDRHSERMIAVGDKAKMMYEKTSPEIRTIRPLRDGVIADFNACEQMMRGLIKMVHKSNRLFTPSLKMVIGVPSGSTEVELRAVRDSAEHAGGREVYLIYEPMAAAIGVGIDVLAPEGNMIVDIGGGSTEIAVISLGGKGVISVTSNVAPIQVQALASAALDGDLDTASSLQMRLQSLNELMFCSVNPIPVKAAMNLIGYDCGSCRLPLTPLPSEHMEKLKRILT